jgi:hypothetical protein
MNVNQKHQQSHARCLLFFFCPASHESLDAWLAVISVHVLKTVPRRPERLRVEGLRRKDRAEGGRARAGERGIVV